ncbi:MAG TPA: hypothetical protein VJQ44_19455 [Gemmatimonadales bacterium]|nr:hypothetical protein [Gemmatimonadales bacterium]
MWGFAFMFWLVPLLLISLVFRRRRWYGRRGAQSWADGTDLRREIETQRGTIERLETTVSQLEERLDFTERLLAGRHEAGATS